MLAYWHHSATGGAFRGQAPSRFLRYAQSRVSVRLLFPQESPPFAPLKYSLFIKKYYLSITLLSFRYSWPFSRASTEPLPSLRSVQGLGSLAFPAGVAACSGMMLERIATSHFLILYIFYINRLFSL